MREREVFRCDIRHLYFDMECEEDTVCQRLILAVEEAKKRMYDPKNLPQFESVKEGTRLIQRIRKAKCAGDLLVASNVDLLFEVQGASFNYEEFEEIYEKWNACEGEEEEEEEGTEGDV